MAPKEYLDENFVLCSEKFSVLSSANILHARRGGSSSDADVRTFWRKNTGFFEIYGRSARTRGAESVRVFCRQEGKGLFFAILCGRLLWTAPNTEVQKGRDVSWC